MHPRGVVTFEAAGQVWKLRFGINALVDLEELEKKSVNEIFAGLDGDKIRVGLLRTVMLAGLSEHHPGVTAHQVGDLMGEVGLPAIGRYLSEAVKAAFPDAQPGEVPAGT